MVRPVYPPITDFPVAFPTGVPTPPSQTGSSVTTPTTQAAPNLTTTQRQYPTIPRHWFSSDEAHAGMQLAIRNLFDMNYDLQDGIKLLTSSNPGFQVSQQAIQGSGAINPSQRANYLISSPTVAALTLGAPRAGIDDGTEITLTSYTNQAHTITATGLLNTGSASVNKATFAAFAGASIHLRANQGFWQVMSSNAITFS
jgi:hypothetical protein